MRRTLQSALLLGLSSLVAAVFHDEVGDIDFHYALLGVPQVETTFFHRPRKDDKASLLYTLSDVGLLGAVNPSTGGLVWRQQVAEDVSSGGGGGHLRAPEGENWVAAAHGRRVQAWNALTGRNVWQFEFNGKVKDLEIMELTESSRKDVLVLFEEDGTTVLRRLHGGLGTVVWEFREVGKDVPLQVSTNIANIYVISLHGSPSSYGIKVTSLDTATGGRVDHWTVGTKGDVQGPQDIMFVGANSAAPILAWASSDLAKLHIQVLGSKSKQEFALPADAVSVDIHAPHLTQSQPHFLVHTRTKSGNKAEVYHTDLKSGQVTKAYELPLLPGLGAFSTSSDSANVYFTRVTEDEVLVFSSDSHAVLARWPFKTGVEPVHAVSEVVKKSGGKDFAVRSAAVTTSEDWVLIRNGELDWTRPEGLSGAVAVAWAEIPEAENLAKVLAEEAHTNPLNAYIHRVTRHINDLQYLPEYLVSIPTGIINSITGGAVGTSKSSGLHRDSFGFNKVIVLATRRGRFYGLDTGNSGEVVWSKSVFPQASDATLDVKGIVSNDAEGVVTVRGAKGEYAVIRVVDGEILEVRSGDESTPVSSTAVMDGETGKWLLALGTDGTPIENVLEGHNLDQTIVIRDEDGIIKGIKFVEEDGKVTKIETWQLQLLPGQKIASVAAIPSHDPVASVGHVLGDRRVNYKYLNRNTIVVAAIDAAESALSVKLVDTVSGQVLASQVHDGVDADKSISCTMSENWYSCAFFGQYTVDDGTNRSIKGYQLVVSDLYESPSPNDRGPLGDADKFSPLEPVDTPTGVPLPWVVSQAWVMSEPLTSLAVTQTRQGITNRQLVAYLPESHAIWGMARHVLDPRRPVDRDPTAAEMEAEGLMRYAPAFVMDGRNFLTHERDVVGIKGIVATPAVVESTTLLVAYGVDVFGSQVAPSGTFDILGKGFNKGTLLATVVALFWGVTFLAPVVRKKQINRKWEAFL